MKDVFFIRIVCVYERGGNVISFRVRPGSLRGRAGERNKVRGVAEVENWERKGEKFEVWGDGGG